VRNGTIQLPIPPVLNLKSLAGENRTWVLVLVLRPLEQRPATNMWGGIPTTDREPRRPTFSELFFAHLARSHQWTIQIFPIAHTTSYRYVPVAYLTHGTIVHAGAGTRGGSGYTRRERVLHAGAVTTHPRERRVGGCRDDVHLFIGKNVRPPGCWRLLGYR
jgi:hypothetical protein